MEYTSVRASLSGSRAGLDSSVRKEQPEGGAMSFGLRGRVDGDAAAVFLDNAVSCPEAQAGTGVFFCADEWLEEALPHGFGDAVAGICDGDDNSLLWYFIPSQSLANTNTNAPSIRGCIQGIAHEVRESVSKVVMKAEEDLASRILPLDDDSCLMYTRCEEGKNGVHDFR